jgi:pimeloyl-ACP methyl ester carboxylesterase
MTLRFRAPKILIPVFVAGLAITMFTGNSANADEDLSATCQTVRVPVPSSLSGPADLEISGNLCYSGARVPDTVQLLVHGATYNSSVWDWSQNPQVYSYVHRATSVGYATFAVDRIGHGASSKPPSGTVSIPNGVAGLSEVVKLLRTGGIAGKTFKKVVWVGHSLGAVYAYQYGGQYSGIDAYVLTGSVHFMKPSWLELIQKSLQPAGPDQGYLTTIPGTRTDLFYYQPNADPAVIAQDEATKDTVTGAEVNSGLSLVFVPADQSPTKNIRVPVLVAMGEHDNLVCDDPDGIVCNTTNLANIEKPYFPNAPRLDFQVVAGSGHALSQHTTAVDAHINIQRWLKDSANV